MSQRWREDKATYMMRSMSVGGDQQLTAQGEIFGKLRASVAGTSEREK